MRNIFCHPWWYWRSTKGRNFNREESVVPGFSWTYLSSSSCYLMIYPSFARFERETRDVFPFVIIAACSRCDKKQSCSSWASMGYCEREYVEYMKINCPMSCKICGGDGGSGGLGQCGFKPIAPIVGGTEAPEGAWPWQAQIRTPTGFTFCGGTLVHPRRVVTAAHCTKPETDGSVSESGAYLPKW